MPMLGVHKRMQSDFGKLRSPQPLMRGVRQQIQVITVKYVKTFFELPVEGQVFGVSDC